MRRLLVVALLFYSCTLAAQTDERRVRTVQIDDGPVSATQPDEGGDFHGISPQSAYWPEVEQAWHAYYVDRCAAHDDSPAGIIARSYAANLSTAQLREVVTFQESPAGRAFIAATRRARQDLEGAPVVRAGRDPDEASSTFREAMLRLKAEYERAPK
jgi:hypothetical protein